MKNQYINWKGIFSGMVCFIFIMFLLDDKLYNSEIKHPELGSRTTSNIIFSYILYFIDKWIGKAGLISVCAIIGLLFIIPSINWKEIFNKKKRD